MIDSIDTPTDLESDVQALQRQQQSFKAYFSLLLASLLVIGGTLNFLLLWQVISVQRTLNANQETVEKFLEEYETVHLPLMNSFVHRLQKFATTDPEFLPILAKYKISMTSTNLVEPVKP